MEWVIGVLSLGLVGLVGYLLLRHNGLVRARTACRTAFAELNAQLTRRHELVPNVVAAVRGYLEHEPETMEAVIDARLMAVGAQTAVAEGTEDATALAMLASAENMLTAALGRLVEKAESYPDLKTSEIMREVQDDLTTTGNQIAFARQAYNDAVTAYNTRREAFTARHFADSRSFGRAHRFEIDDPHRHQAPPISF